MFELVLEPKRRLLMRVEGSHSHRSEDYIDSLDKPGLGAANPSLTKLEYFPAEALLMASFVRGRV